MRSDELRQMDNNRLDEQLDECYGRWRDLRFEEAVGKLTATSEIGNLRRTIARIKTIKTEREMAAVVAAGESWPYPRKEREVIRYKVKRDKLARRTKG